MSDDGMQAKDWESASAEQIREMIFETIKTLRVPRQNGPLIVPAWFFEGCDEEDLQLRKKIAEEEARRWGFSGYIVVPPLGDEETDAGPGDGPDPEQGTHLAR